MASNPIRLRILAPVKGLLQGRDPALPDERYSPDFSPDMENIRVQGSLWEVRAGIRAWSRSALTGTNRTRYLETVYTSNGNRYRLGARGADGSVRLYDWLEGTDSSWQTVGAADLGGGFFQGVTARDKHYFTTRVASSVLQKYDPSAGTRADVTAATGPAAAPTVTPSIWGYLELWQGTTPFGWGETDHSLFGLYEANDDNLDIKYGFDVGNTVRLTSQGGSRDKRVWDNVFGDRIESAHIAFFLESLVSDPQMSFDFGISKPGEFLNDIRPPRKQRTYLFAVGTGNLATINYKRFRSQKGGAERTLRISPIFLPGRLQGTYRYRYSHYDPTGLSESTFSPASEPADFSAILTRYSDGSADGMRKVALVKPVTDSGTVAATTKLRLYRTGGIPELTQDAAGQEVWLKVLEILDLSTTLTGAHAAGVTNLTLAAVGNGAGNLADGDWLVLDSGIPDFEEFVRIQNYLYTDLVIDPATNTIVTSALRPFVAADVNRTLTVRSSTGFTAATYTINSVAFGAATLSAAVGSLSATGGKATLSAVVAGTLNVLLAFPTLYAHANADTVQAVFGDNMANEVAGGLLGSARTTVERDGPPTGIQWLSRAPDGRIWAANYDSNRDSIAVSNMPTPDRLTDFEVFPNGVNPLIRRNPVQGWRFSLAGGLAGDEIAWAGFFREVYTVLTRLVGYQVSALSQVQWGPSAVAKRLDRGCVAGRTVCELNGALYWVADGPTVLRWDGHGPPEDIGHLRITELLQQAPAGTPAATGTGTNYWEKWFAVPHSDENNVYLRLCILPSDYVFTDLQVDSVTNTKVKSRSRLFVAADVGLTLSIDGGTGFTKGDYTISSVTAGVATLNASPGATSITGGTAKLHRAFPWLWLDYNVVTDCWEPRAHYTDGNSDDVPETPIRFEVAHVPAGPGDDKNLLQAVYDTTTGTVYEAEVGRTDAGEGILFRASTKRYDLDAVASFERAYVYLERALGGCDRLNVTVTMGGSEYGMKSRKFQINLAGDGDTELFIRGKPAELKGRWVQFTLAGVADSAPAIREIDAEFTAIRMGRVTP